MRELRKARKIIQEQMAKTLGVDLHISALRRSIEAMGGELTLMAKFPDGAPVKVTGLAIRLSR